MNWRGIALAAAFIMGAGNAANAQQVAGQTPQSFMPVFPFPMPVPAPMPSVPMPSQPGMPATGSPPAMDPTSAWMMSVMGPVFAMANPYMYGQWMAMMYNPMMDEMTRHKALEAMMEAFDPEAMLGGMPNAGWPKVVIPGFPTQTRRNVKPNTVTDGISTSAKRKAYQTMMMMSPLSMRDMIGIMADKMKVAEDLSFEDAVDSMKLRANEINFKLVAHNPLWLDVRAISGDEDTPRVEIFQFCDAMVARKVLDHVPEFAVFLPCRIALIEDANKQLWVMTLDWDVSWMDFAQNPNSDMGNELRADAKRIRDGIRYIMEGAATGDF